MGDKHIENDHGIITESGEHWGLSGAGAAERAMGGLQGAHSRASPMGPVT